MQILAYLLARFSEPSSYAGIGAVLALLGLHFSDTVIGQLAQFLAAGCALAALLLKERGIIKSLALAAGLAAAVALAPASRSPTPPSRPIRSSSPSATPRCCCRHWRGLTRCGSPPAAAPPRRSPDWRRTQPAPPGSRR